MDVAESKLSLSDTTTKTIEGGIRAPREGERYFSLVKVDQVNFESPDNVRHKVAFDTR